jgi:hypothetical protein
MSASEILRRDRQRKQQKKESRDRRRQLIRWKRLLEILPYGETEIRERFLATGKLRRVPLGPRAVGFVEDEAWALVDELIEARDAALTQETEALALPSAPNTQTEEA